MMVPKSTNREFHNSIKGAAVFAALFLFVCSLNGETLWESEFQGYIVDGAALGVGDIISVTVTPHTKLSLDTTHVDSQQGKLSFTGGEGTSLFSFLPEGTSNLSKEIEEESSYSLETSIPARLVERDSRGLFRLDGSRTITINRKEEVLSLSGWCDPASVSTQGVIDFDKLYNAVLEYTSPGLQQSKIITQEDLQENEADTAQAQQTGGTAGLDEDGQQTGQDIGAEGAETETEEATGVDAEEVGSAEGTSSGPELTPEKQRELLLQYFNRFIDTLFSPAE